MQTAFEEPQRPRRIRSWFYGHTAGFGARRTGSYWAWRRSRTEKVTVLGMVVRLYVEAHVMPTFSKSGPLVRFVNDIAELLGEPGTFTTESMNAKFK